MADPLIIARNADAQAALLPQLANRHGCITGATGTGKTVTLQVLAESFSRIGTPVFMADVKGDLSGISQAGAASPKLARRLADLGLPEPAWGGSPTTLWDIFGEQGHPIRATVSDLGPLLLSRMLDLNDTQEGVLTLAFRVADDEGLLLLDMKDLRAMLSSWPTMPPNCAPATARYPRLPSARSSAICCVWNPRVPSTSSVNPCWTSSTGCVPMPRGAA